MLSDAHDIGWLQAVAKIVDIVSRKYTADASSITTVMPMEFSS
jgi:hypothetical protein